MTERSRARAPAFSSRTVSHSEPSGAPSRPIRIAVVFVGATGASLPLLYVHVATAGLGALLIAVYVWQVSSEWPKGRAVRAAIVLALLALAVAPPTWSGSSGPVDKSIR